MEIIGIATDPALLAFAATRVGFDVAERWDDERSPCPLLESALVSGGPAGRLVRIVVDHGRVSGFSGLPALPAGRHRAAERLAAAIGAESARIGVDVVVGPRNRWWFGGVLVFDVTTPSREPAGAY